MLDPLTPGRASHVRSLHNLHHPAYTWEYSPSSEAMAA